MALSAGATYTFSITVNGGVAHFVASQGSTKVWSNDVATSANYVVISSQYSGNADYQDYEEVWKTSTSGGSPAFDFYFYDNYWAPTSGGEYAATWTPYFYGAPSNVAVTISGNSVLVHNPQATLQTALTLDASTTTPSAGEQYTLSGYLTDSIRKYPIANKQIEIWFRYPGQTDWTKSNIALTGSDGYYSTPAFSSQTVDLQAEYPGDSSYVGASSKVVRITVGVPTLALATSNSNPSPGEQYTLSGYLRDSAGKGVAGKPIDIFYHYEGSDWAPSNTISSDANGYYSTPASSSKTVYLQTGYKVNGVYVASSNVVTINVQQQGATTLTLTSSNYNPLPGEQYTLSGYLRDSAGKGIAGRYIGIWWHAPGENWWHFSNWVGPTGTDGKYSTTVTSSKPLILQTGFPGDGTTTGYTASSSSVVTINVGAAHLTLSYSNSNLLPGQQYTLFGYLLDANRGPLANKPIDIYYHTIGGNWQFSNTLYTGADGKYSMTTSSSKTVYLQTGYKVNGVYVASSNVVTIHVGETSLQLYTSRSYLLYLGQTYTISGALVKELNGDPLANRPIQIWYHVWYQWPSETDWHYSNTIYTGADGKFSEPTAFFPSLDWGHTISIQARFLGDKDGSYMSSSDSVDVFMVHDFGT